MYWLVIKGKLMGLWYVWFGWKIDQVGVGVWRLLSDKSWISRFTDEPKMENTQAKSMWWQVQPYRDTVAVLLWRCAWCDCDSEFNNVIPVVPQSVCSNFPAKACSLPTEDKCITVQWSMLSRFFAKVWFPILSLRKPWTRFIWNFQNSVASFTVVRLGGPG